MSEPVFLGGRPVIHPERIYIGVGDVGDLLAYRQEWEPFIAAHLELWRDLNSRFENSVDVTKCPAGIFTNDQIPKTLDPVWQSWCASLSLTRMMTSPTDPRGILPRWNAWANKSSAEIVTQAASMLAWLQDVVMNVGGPDKIRLEENAKQWGIDIKLPELPSFSTQQEIIARTEGAYISTKGVLQIIGYGAGETLRQAGDVTQAVAQGLKDTAQDLPKTARWIGIAAAVTAVLVAGGLIVYYVPRKPKPRELPAAS